MGLMILLLTITAATFSATYHNYHSLSVRLLIFFT